MKRPVFAFNNYFLGADRAYSLDEQATLLKSLGYDATYLSINARTPEGWAEFLAWEETSRRHGLDVAAYYTVFNPEETLPEGAHGLGEILATLPTGATLELALSLGWKKDVSDPAKDAGMLLALEPFLAVARERGITISLYHHFGFWMETTADTVRLARAINDPVVRVSFCGFHWHAVDAGDLDRKLDAAAPWLHLVNICGSRPQPADSTSPLPKTIEPVGEGDFPLAPLLGKLDALGYAGPVGFQGYQIGGHPPDTLRRSIEAFRRIEAVR